MSQLASVFVVAGESGRAQDLISCLRRINFTGTAVLPSGTQPPSSIPPDIFILLDDIDLDGQLACAAVIRKTQTHVPICLLTRERTEEVDRRAYEAGIDDMLTYPLDEVKLIARLRPLVRLSTMLNELTLRQSELQRHGIAVDSDADLQEKEPGYRLLLVGEAAKGMSGLFNGVEIVLAEDPYQAESLLGGPNFDAAILAPGSDPEPFLDLCTKLRNNPRLFNLPVLMAVAEGSVDESDAYRRGANEVLQWPRDRSLFYEATRFLVRRQRLRWSIRSSLSKTLVPANLDAPTGLYNRAFLDSYLVHRVASAADGTRHLSLILLRISDIERVRRHFGDRPAAHLKRQLAQWITGLARGEDLCAASAKNEFCLVLPDTPEEEAAVVMHRISSVLSYTDFAVHDVYQPVRIWVQEGCAGLKAGESASELFARIQGLLM